MHEPPLIPKHKSKAFAVGPGGGPRRVITTKDFYCIQYEEP